MRPEPAGTEQAAEHPNYGYAYNSFEVDTVAPKFGSGKPTSRSVSLYADVAVIFDDRVYNLAKFVNNHKKSSNTPLDVDRYTYGKKITLYVNDRLRRDTCYTVRVSTGVNEGNQPGGTYNLVIQDERLRRGEGTFGPGSLLSL